MIAIEQWQAGGDMLEIAGRRIFVRSAGSGEALLLIHGFPTSSWDWARLWPALTARHRVIAFDLLGFGFSDKPADDAYTIQQQADIAEALLTHFGIARYRLIAHDYGDTVAQELLARSNAGSARQVLLAAVLLNGGLFPETHRPLLMQRLLAGPLGPAIARLSSYRRFAANLRRVCKRPLDDAELRVHWSLLQRTQGLHVLPKLIGYMRQRRVFRARWVGALVHTDVPVRVIAGLDDPISGAHMLARYRDLVATADAIGLPGVGHYPQIEAADEVLAAIGNFLDAPVTDSP